MKPHLIATLLIAFIMPIKTSGMSQTDTCAINITPKPLITKAHSGFFTINQATAIIVKGKIGQAEAKLLSDKISHACGIQLRQADKASDNCITFAKTKGLQPEEYKIEVNDKRIQLSASTECGMFYALQTLFQLLPPEIEGHIDDGTTLKVPCISIADRPKFSYRGLMIDVCRHFFTIDELKKQISVMAMLKLNRLHLHLTDNQGWRIDIKRYPQLVKRSAVQETYGNGDYGPYYYTDSDIKELVEYASKNHVEIIPEIEFPGHSLGALVAFPQLSCSGGPFRSEQVFGYEENVFCVGNDSVFTFMENVLKEIARMFPSQYIHIGGDECVKTYWKTCPRCQGLAKRLGLKPTKDHTVEEQLQSYAIKRMERYISRKLGKKMLGWEEISEGGLSKGATVMSWKGTESGALATANGNDVIMASMADGLYLCSAQGADEVEPAAMGGHSYLKDVYKFEPVPKNLSAERSKHIIGVQACQWSEWTLSGKLLEYMLYPRAIALAEVAWTTTANKDYNNFLYRLADMQRRLFIKGVNFHIPLPEGELTTNKVYTGNSVVLRFTNSRSLPMVYTLDGSEPKLTSAPVTDSIVLRNPYIIKVATIGEGGIMSKTRSIRIEKQKPAAALAHILSKDIRLLIADGLYKDENEFSKASFSKDTIIHSFSDYSKSRYSFKKPSLAVYSGEIEVPETGVYTFRCNADELWIADKRVVYNPTLSRFYRHRGQIALQKGVHRFKLVLSNHLKDGFAPEWYDIDFRYTLPSGGEWIRKK